MKYSNGTYLIGDVVKILGINRENLRDWLHRKYLKPSIQEKQGKRVLNRFTTYDLCLIETFRTLVNASFSRDQSKLMVDYMRKDEDSLTMDSTRHLVFFKWPTGNRHIHLWPKGEIAPLPLYKIIRDEDTPISFSTIFEGIDDMRSIPFEWAFILNFKLLRKVIENMIAVYEKSTDI